MTISFIVPTMANQLAACPHWKLECGVSEESCSAVRCSGSGSGGSGIDLSSLEGWDVLSVLGSIVDNAQFQLR